MAFQTIPQSNFASGVGSALGQGVGQGLSEQIPKEVERVRLSQGLQNIGKDLENLSPMEQIAKLAGIPGMDINTAAQFLPYIQQAQAKEAYKKRTGEAGNTQAGIQQQSKPVSTYQERRLAPTYLSQPTPKEKSDMVNQLMATGEAVTLEQAEKRAGEFFSDRFAADQGIENKIGVVDKYFEQQATQRFQKQFGDRWKDIIGDMEQGFKQKAYDEAIDKGKNPLTAADEATSKLLNFGKSRLDLKTLGSKWIASERRPQIQKSIDEISKVYRKFGQEEQLENDLVTYYKFPRELASQFSYPFNTKIQKDLKEAKNVFKPTPGIPLPIQMISAVGVLQEVPDELVSKIEKDVDENTGLSGIALALRDKGYNPQSFMDKMASEKFR